MPLLADQGESIIDAVPVAGLASWLGLYLQRSPGSSRLAHPPGELRASSAPLRIVGSASSAAKTISIRRMLLSNFDTLTLCENLGRG
jgi:hypothetical protein